MAKQQETPVDPEPIGQVLAEIADKSQKLMHALAERRYAGNGADRSADPLNLRPTLLELTARLMADPARLVQAQLALWQDYLRLWQSTGRRLLGQPAAPVAEPEQGDRRFRDPAWDDHALFDFIKQSYLLTARWLVGTVNQLDGLDAKSRQKIDFYTRQFVDAMAPSNFVATNPEVLRATLETGGENLLRGLNNLLDDLARGDGKLAIRMTDLDAFALGCNLALTPGKVVFQTDLMQLIQYAPTTAEVHARPLLIIPPWINKYYILDLQPKNSFIKYAVDQGFTVFVISWVNPGEELHQKTFEDYMVEGPLAALDAMAKATGETGSTVIGYCLGGTLLAAMLAYLATKRDQRIQAATFFASLVDFEQPGELGVFIDEEQLAAMDRMMAERGYLDGRHMATTFNMLRANDLIWSFVVNNYLFGQGAVPVRPALLELRQHAHALRHAQLLSAQVLPGEPAGGAGRHQARGRADRPAQDPPAGLHPLDPRGPHRTLGLDLPGDPALWRRDHLRARGLGPHRGRGQPALGAEIRLLDPPRAAARSPGLARRGDPPPGQLVAALAGVERPPFGRAGAGPPAGRRPAAGARGRAGILRARARVLSRGRRGSHPATALGGLPGAAPPFRGRRDASRAGRSRPG